MDCHLEDNTILFTITLAPYEIVNVGFTMSTNIKVSFDPGMYEKQPIEISHGKHRNGKARHTRYK